MPTSNSYNYTISRDSIIAAALRKIGVIGDYESPSAEQLSAAGTALNLLIKSLSNRGMTLWTTAEQYIPFSNWASTNTVEIGPGATIPLSHKPMRIIQALRRDNITPAAPVDVPMQIYTFENYQLLPQKLSSGAPIIMFYQPLRTTGKISLWPIPSSYWVTNGQLYIRYIRQLQDFDTGADEADVPVEWAEALVYQLAVRLAPEYGLPMNERMLLKQEADALIKQAEEDAVEEGSIFIHPIWK